MHFVLGSIMLGFAIFLDVACMVAGGVSLYKGEAPEWAVLLLNPWVILPVVAVLEAWFLRTMRLATHSARR